jgi:hypothetical protein
MALAVFTGVLPDIVLAVYESRQKQKLMRRKEEERFARLQRIARNKELEELESASKNSANPMEGIRVFHVPQDSKKMSSGKVRQERKPPTSYQNMTSINEK